MNVTLQSRKLGDQLKLLLALANQLIPAQMRPPNCAQQAKIQQNQQLKIIIYEDYMQILRQWAINGINNGEAPSLFMKASLLWGPDVRHDYIIMSKCDPPPDPLPTPLPRAQNRLHPPRCVRPAGSACPRTHMQRNACNVM